MRETTMLLFGVLAGEDDGRNDETTMHCSGCLLVRMMGETTRRRWVVLALVLTIENLAVSRVVSDNQKHQEIQLNICSALVKYQTDGCQNLCSF